MKQKRDGTVLRSPKDQRRWYNYVTKHKITSCDFCAYNDSPDKTVSMHNHFMVIRNIFPYKIWEGVEVIEHLMLIPCRHVTSVSEFTDEESLEHTKLLGYYEDKGYSTYARSHQNQMKSVPHQHTHLLKIGSKPKRMLVFLRKPHVLISR